MQIEWSEQALNDLADILRYVAEKFGLTAARRVQTKIRNDVSMIADFPLMGTVIYDDPKSKKTYYSLTSKYQKIVYITDNDRLRIITLWNTHRDSNAMKRLLSDNE